MRPLIQPSWSALPRAAGTLSLALSLALFGAACGPSGGLTNQRPPGAGEGPVVPVEVRDADFSASLFSVLRDGQPTAARSGLLVGVVRRQLAHAAERFGAGHRERATDSVLGALYLVRAGEGRAEMVDAAGQRALAEAIEVVSPRGDEGRAQAMLELRAAALAAGSPARAEVDAHLAALDRWMKDTRTGPLIVRLGAEERALVARALIDSRPEALARAADAVAAWIDAAIDVSIAYRATQRRPTRDEAIEVTRATESGAATLVALYLRHGDARGAVDHIDRSSARRVIPPSLYQRVKAAAADSAGAWQGLAVSFARHAAEERDAETGIDPDLLDAAVWGAALEAYRRDPLHLETAGLVSQVLVRFGMSEAAPLVLGHALGDKPSPGALAASLDLVLGALSREASVEDYATSRRVFAAASPLLVLADQAARARVALDPSAARVRFLMASIELRAGHLPGAIPLLRAAMAEEPSVAGLTLLAMAERQAGDAAAALADVRRALSAPDARMSPLEITEAHLLAFELHRAGGAPERAKEELALALEGALDARVRAPDAVGKARAERILGRVLDAYGDAKGAARAHERALALAADERPLLGATMLEAVGRALVRHDLPAAREALKRALEGNAEAEDLVYGGLWVLLLERELRVASDGTAGRALEIATDRASWTAKLAAWANGKISDADLGTLAQSAAQRVEVQFYTAMAKKVAGDPAAVERLRAVSNSPILDLLEVHLAREMLAPALRPELPRNVRLP